mgnify:CR=1 FL=1
MEGFLHAVSSVTIILLLTATGYFCAARGWMAPQAKAFIGKFTLSVAIPCMSVYGLTNNLTRDLLVQSGSFLLVPLLGTVVITILSLLVGRLLKLPRKKLGVFMMMCSVSNAIFVGLAMCTELFGDTCTPYVMLYYLVNTSFVQLLFLSLVRWSGESRGFDLKMLQKFLTTPAVIAVFVGLALVWFEVRLPSLVMSYCRYMNNLVTPLALLLTGYIIHDIGLKNVRLDRDLGIAMIFRFLLAPALSVALCRAFGVTGLAHDVLIVETAMPVVTQTVVAAAEYGAALDLRLCDGLRGIAPHEADTLVMAGMGGETIIQILTDSPWPRTSGCTLLLQPQTKVELLRRWLSENGYACRDERLVWDKGKLYVVLQMAAGEAFTPEEARLYAGFCLENDPLYGDYLDAQLRRLRRRLEGLHRSREDADCGTLPELIAALEKKKEALS